ncbi:MAG: L,D-transpeptidase family protein [Lachnospiraceae bacterium]|nr:L,D-transpeptidase family protein [Lachnospiraceae bacterium]
MDIRNRRSSSKPNNRPAGQNSQAGSNGTAGQGRPAGHSSASGLNRPAGRRTAPVSGAGRAAASNGTAEFRRPAGTNGTAGQGRTAGTGNISGANRAAGAKRPAGSTAGQKKKKLTSVGAAAERLQQRSKLLKKRSVKRKQGRNGRLGEKQFSPLRTGAVIAAAVIAILLISYCLIAASYSEKFLPNTYINGFKVGGKSVDYTEELLKNSVEKYQLEVSFRGGKNEIIKSSDIDLTYVSSNEVQQLMDQQKRLSWLAAFFGKKTHSTVRTSFHFDSDRLKTHLAGLSEFAEENISYPVSSKIALNSDLTYRITDSSAGNNPDLDVIFQAVDSAINSSESRLSLELVEGAYKAPAATEDDEDLIASVEKLNKFVSTTVTIKFRDGETEVIDKERLTSWIGKNDDGLYEISSEKIYTKIYGIFQKAAPKYEDVKTTMPFTSTMQGDVVEKCNAYGYRISIENESDKVYSALYDNKDTTVEVENSIKETVDSTFGGTYIEIDITGQHLYYYENGSIVLDSPFVSGLESDPERRTPSGVYSVFDLQRDITLGSLQAKDESQRYESFVSYWMPFFESYGMHDASWRDEYGGEIYKTAGSHGCVNLPPEFAAKLYNNIEIWTPVIVLRYGDNADA